MRRAVIHDRPVIDNEMATQEDVVGYRRVSHATWSPAQPIAIAVGLVLVVVGGVALARTGLAFDHIPTTHAHVAGLPHTSLSGLIDLLTGVVVIGGGAVPGAARGLMTVLGVVLLGSGLVIAIQPTSFHRWFGYDEGSGVFLAVLGSVMLVAAMVSPVIRGSSDRRAVSRSREVVD